MQYQTDLAYKKSLIEKKLEESGEKDRLIQYLRQKLVEQQWKQKVKSKCICKSHLDYYRIQIEIIRSKGLQKINLEELVQQLLPHGRALVTEKTKQDLLGRIKSVLDNDSDYKRMMGI